MKHHPIRLALLAAISVLVLSACATPIDADSASASPRSGKPSANNEPSAASALETLPTYLTLVRQMQSSGMWFASLAHIDAMEQKFGRTADTQLLRADALRHTEHFAASQALYLQLLDTPARAAAHRGLGLLAGAQRQFVLAAEELEKARQLLPTDGWLLNDLGYAHLMAAQFSSAQMPLMQATQLLQGNPKVASNLALYFLVVGQPAEARQVMDQSRIDAETRQSIQRLAQSLNPQHRATPAPGQLRLKNTSTLTSFKLSQSQTADRTE
jgi:Flp pilus assembly protein TadD